MKKSVLTLDDGNEYLEVEKVEANGNKYSYLINLKKFKENNENINQEDIKFMKEIEKGVLEEIANPEIIKSLLPLFAKESESDLNRIIAIFESIESN